MFPFEKLALNDWYLDTFFPIYKMNGGGWEFGALSQAVIGGGIAEAVLRGGAVAALSVGLMKWYRSPTTSWWRLPLYLYVLTLAFLSIRDTTFRPLTESVQIALPALFFIEVVAGLVADVTPPTKVAGPKLPLTTNV